MSDTRATVLPDGDVLQMTVEIVAAYVGQNQIPAAQIPELLGSVYRSLAHIDGHAPAPAPEAARPAVPVKRSVTPDYIVCLEDGKKLKMLKRHLRTAYGMSPDQYRAKWGLAADYPMVAPNYANARSEFAKTIGLGRNPASTPAPRRPRAATTVAPATE